MQISAHPHYFGTLDGSGFDAQWRKLLAAACTTLSRFSHCAAADSGKCAAHALESMHAT
jgi:hypothetical protein